MKETIKKEVKNRLVAQIVSEIETEYIQHRWNGNKEIWDSVLEKLKEEQENTVKKILQEFYDSYRYGKKDLTILKKLKELLKED